MSVNDGEKVNAAVSNTSWVSKQDVTGNKVQGIIDLDNTTDPNSGVQVPNVQEKINDNADRLTVNEADIDQNELDIASNTQENIDSRLTSGTANADVNMGAYTGAVLNDNESAKQNIQQLSDAVEGIPSGLAFQGNWDADTNTPALVSSTGTSGHYYVVSVAGTTSLDGESDWGVGDWAIFTDTGVWIKSDNSDNVTSVNGKTGTVVLDTDDITEGATNLYYTDVRADARIAAASIDDLSDVDTSSVAPTDGQVLTWNNANSEWEPQAAGGGGGGSGSGLKSFVDTDSSNFENGVGSWLEFDDGAVAIPVDGTGGSPANISGAVTVVSGEVQEGTQSYKITKSAANAQGQGVSLNLEDIALGYQDDIAYGSILIDFTSANYANTVGVWIYDIDNATIFDVLEPDNLIGNIKGKFNFSFNVPDNDPDVSQLRLIIMETDTNTNAYDLIFDVAKVNPKKDAINNLNNVNITLNTSPGYGSGATRVLRFSNALINSDNGMLSFSSDANNAARVNFLVSGMYNVYFQFQSSDTDREYGITLNQTDTTLNISSNPPSQIVASGTATQNRRNSISITRFFNAGDNVRPSADGGTISTTTDDCRFAVTRVEK